MLLEIGRPIKWYEGLYAVTSTGEVYNVRNPQKPKLVSQKTRKDGYKEVRLYRDNYGTSYLVHRLVAFAYIPNPDPNKVFINHRNEDRGDNRVENLEWCTSLYNSRYGTGAARGVETRKRKKSNCKPVICTTTHARYDSLLDAEHHTGVDRTNIGRVCNGKRETAGGMKWRYAE